MYGNIPQYALNVVAFTRKISGLIHQIQEGTANAVTTMQEGAEEVSTGAEALNEAAVVIEKVVKAGDLIASMVQDIAAAVQEQTASMQELADSADELAHIAKEMKIVVDKFVLDTGVQVRKAQGQRTDSDQKLRPALA